MFAPAARVPPEASVAPTCFAETGCFRNGSGVKQKMLGYITKQGALYGPPPR